jgi:hypothetical protein
MKLGSLFRRAYPTVPTSCDGAEFALQAIAASRKGRGDPERTYQAQRAGIFVRLTQQGRVTGRDAEQWISRWEHEAEGRGLSRRVVGFWDQGWDWIAEQRRAD